MCCAVLYCFFLCFLQISARKILFGLISTITSISAPLRLLFLTRLCRRADEQNCAWNTNWFFLSSSLRPSFLSSSFSLVWIWLLLRSLFLLHSWQDHLFLHPHLTRSSSFLANLPFFFWRWRCLFTRLYANWWLRLPPWTLFSLFSLSFFLFFAVAGDRELCRRAKSDSSPSSVDRLQSVQISR